MIRNLNRCTLYQTQFRYTIKSTSLHMELLSTIVVVFPALALVHSNAEPGWFLYRVDNAHNGTCL